MKNASITIFNVIIHIVVLSYVIMVQLNYYPSCLFVTSLQCVVCHKEFVSAEFMKSHMQRRHPDHLSTDVKYVNTMEKS